MPEILINSNDWLAISLRNGTIGMFYLRDVSIWQCLRLDDEQINDLHRHLMKFSPNGQIFVCNGLSKQLYVYIQSDWTKTNVSWILHRKIVSRNLPLSIDVTNRILFIADIDGDIYRIDLTSNDSKEDLVMSSEYCIMKNKFMSLDIVFNQINETNTMLITADRDDRIRLSHYPNTSDSLGYCRGHTEFISHMKLIDHQHILSASADGTIRLWRIPSCLPLVLFHAKAFLLFSKDVYYSESNIPGNSCSSNDFQDDIKTPEILSQTSSMIDYAIWKMDTINTHSNILLAFSIYAHRSRSIYLTNLDNIKQLANEQRKLIFDYNYGTIVDYCFTHSTSGYNLYVLFDRNLVVRIDVGLIYNSQRRELLVPFEEMTNEINRLLTRDEFFQSNDRRSVLIFDEMIFGQGLKNSTNSISQVSHKRKDQSIEIEQRKKAIVTDIDDCNPGEECA